MITMRHMMQKRTLRHLFDVFLAQTAKYGLDELFKVSMPEGFADHAGKLINTEKGLCYNFGKHKDKLVAQYPSYAEWMIKSDFPQQTKDLLKKHLSI